MKRNNNKYLTSFQRSIMTSKYNVFSFINSRKTLNYLSIPENKFFENGFDSWNESRYLVNKLFLRNKLKSRPLLSFIYRKIEYVKLFLFFLITIIVPVLFFLNYEIYIALIPVYLYTLIIILKFYIKMMNTKKTKYINYQPFFYPVAYIIELILPIFLITFLWIIIGAFPLFGDKKFAQFVIKNNINKPNYFGHINPIGYADIDWHDVFTNDKKLVKKYSKYKNLNPSQKEYWQALSDRNKVLGGIDAIYDRNYYSPIYMMDNKKDLYFFNTNQIIEFLDESSEHQQKNNAFDWLIYKTNTKTKRRIWPFWLMFGLINHLYKFIFTLSMLPFIIVFGHDPLHILIYQISGRENDGQGLQFRFLQSLELSSDNYSLIIY